MPKTKAPEDLLSRGEAIWVVDWLVNVKHIQPPRRGFYSILRLAPSEVAKRFGVTETEVLTAARRKLPQPA